MNKILTALLSNHVLANLAFVLVLVMGISTYLNLPREKDPEINFNWIQIITVLPGASAEDVEDKVTNLLEEAVDRVEDIKFISSSSRESISTILVRFEDIPERKYDKRLNDLYREVQNKAEQELPIEVDNPFILEITTANAFPTAMLVLNGNGEDEILRRQAYLIKKDLEQIKGVYEVATIGLHKPQLQVELLLDSLQNYGLNPTQIADSVRALFNDIAAGSIDIGKQQWLLRLVGSETEADQLGQFMILTPSGQLQLDQVAKVQRSWEKPETLVKFKQKPGVIFAVNKESSANTITLVEELKQFIKQRNSLLPNTGLQLELLDDQTGSTRQAIGIMQTNALIGLAMVLVITWLFLGWRLATKMNTMEANQMIQQQWQEKLQAIYPDINLDFSGELDDIQESLDAMVALFMMGIGIMYMILGAQFRSYFQPLMILLTVVPLAFVGVVIGLIVSQNPLSLFTLYGVVALTGIAVNAAIVLMAAARDRLKAGMSINHATILSMQLAVE